MNEAWVLVKDEKVLWETLNVSRKECARLGAELYYGRTMHSPLYEADWEAWFEVPMTDRKRAYYFIPVAPIPEGCKVCRNVGMGPHLKEDMWWPEDDC